MTRTHAPELTTQSSRSLIVRSIADYEAERRGEHRSASRFVPRNPLGGTLDDMPFTVLQVSTEGLRIRHDAPLLEGQVVPITLALPSPEPVIPMEAQVVWTSVGERCVSGLRVLDRETLHDVLDRLDRANELMDDAGDRGSSPLGDLTDAEVALILRAIRRGKSLEGRVDQARVDSVVTWLCRTRESAAEAHLAL